MSTGPPPLSTITDSRSDLEPSRDGSNDAGFQRQILNVLNRMCEKMDGYEGLERPGHLNGAGFSAQSHSEPLKHTLFGIPRQHFNYGQQFNPINGNYEKILPQDAYGEEAGPNARVFKVYNEEATAYDTDMVGHSSDSSDVLLVFAGLFSAVLTTFVVQTSQALETDTSAISNSLLSEIIHLLRAQVYERKKTEPPSQRSNLLSRKRSRRGMICGSTGSGLPAWR